MNHPEIFLLRHGQTTWNRVDRHQGHMDSPLTLRGCEQARGYGRRLAAEIDDWSAVTIHCSTKFRCRQTAAIACDEAGADVEKIIYDERLIERSYGQWEGLTTAEIEKRYPEDVAGRRVSRWDYVIPGGGESYERLRERITRWLSEQPPASRLVVFSHGVAGRMLRGLYLGLSKDEILGLDEPQDQIVQLTQYGAGRLDSIG